MKRILIILAFLASVVFGKTNDFTLSTTWVGTAYQPQSPPPLSQIQTMFGNARNVTNGLMGTLTLIADGISNSTFALGVLTLGTNLPAGGTGTFGGYTSASNTTAAAGVVGSNGVQLLIGTGAPPVSCQGLFVTNVSGYANISTDLILTQHLGYADYLINITDRVTTAKGNVALSVPTTNALGLLCNGGCGLLITLQNQSTTNLLLTPNIGSPPILPDIPPIQTSGPCGNNYIVPVFFNSINLNWICSPPAQQCASYSTGLGYFIFNLTYGYAAGVTTNVPFLDAQTNANTEYITNGTVQGFSKP